MKRNGGIRSFLVFFVFVSFFSSNAFGANWKFVISAQSGETGEIKFYLDTDSIKANGDMKKFWTKTVFSEAPPPQVGASLNTLKKTQLLRGNPLMLMILYVFTYHLCCNLISYCPYKITSLPEIASP